MRNVRGLVALTLVAGLAGCSSCTKSKAGTTAPPPVVEQPKPLPPPVGIAGLSPAQGPTTGGTVLVVRGYNFTPTVKVKFGSAEATDVTVADPQTLTLTTPPGAAGSVDVVVTNSDGATQTFAKGFGYYALTADAKPAPVVQAVQPNSGPASGGTVALIAGSDFQAGAIVVVGGRPARAQTFVDAARVTATLAGGPVGTAKVAVTNPDGRSGLLLGGFAYYDPASAGAPPKLTSIAPADGPVGGGQQARAAGEALSAQVLAFLGGRPVTLDTQSATGLGFHTPAGARGLADFAVTNPDGQSAVLAGAYNYFAPPPAVLAVEPYYGPVAGGTALTLRGQGFATGATATVGGQALTNLIVVSDAEITGVAPAGAAGGAADVTVTNPDGLADTLAGAYYYTDADHLPPASGAVALTRLSPNVGPATGGLSVSAFGGGFQAGATVTVGGAAATGVRVLGSTSLSFTLPAGSIGPADVVVTNPGGAHATLRVGFTYFDPTSTAAAPRLSAVQPSTAPRAGGATVALTGTGFLDGARVFFGFNESTRVHVTSAGQAAADVPAGEPGAVDLLLVNPDGKSDRLASGFAYFDPQDGGAQAPTVTEVAPPQAYVDETTQVTVAGTGFQTGAVAFFGDVSCAVQVVSPTLLNVTVPPHAAGTVDVAVTNPDGQGARLPAAFVYQARPAPTVTGATPSSGSTEGTTTVTVTGTGFVPGTTVTIDGVEVPTTYVSPTEVIAQVPPSDGGGGATTIGVTNPDGQHADAPSGTFTYVVPPAPTITDVTPSSGSTEGTTTVTVTGTGFEQGTVITIDGVAVPTTYVSPTEVTAQIPPTSGSGGPVTIGVTNPDGQHTDAPGGTFTYVAPPPPVITSLSPASTLAGTGATVTVNGAGFVSGALVTLDGTAVPTTFVSDTQLTATFPARTASTPVVGVTNPDGKHSDAPAGSFAYVNPPPPVITAVSPTSGSTEATTTVTVTGTGFVPGTVITIDGVAVPTTFVSATQVTAQVPPRTAGGNATIGVTNPDGQHTDAQSGTFTYVVPPPPAISSVSPTAATAGASVTVTVNGTGFVQGTVISVDGQAVPTTYVGPGQVTATFPAHPAGSPTITVTNPDGQHADAAAGSFTYVPAPAPTVTAVSPGSGPADQPASVALTGTNFVSGATVSVDGVAATGVTVVSATRITCTLPAHAGGRVDIVVSNPDHQSATLTGAFVYVLPPPTVAAVNPSVGPTAGNSAVLVTGTNFETGAQVFFGGAAAVSTVLDSGAIRCIAPAGSPGKVDVTVQNPDGLTGTLTQGYEYRANYVVGPAPTITSLIPATGPTTGGTKAVLNGTGFAAGMSVDLGGKQAQVVVLSPTQATLTAPANLEGAADVTAVNPDGQYGTLLRGFTYVDPSRLGAAPACTGATPSRGPASGTTNVYVTGSKFQSGAIFFVRDTVAPNIRFVNGSLLQGQAPPQAAGPADVTVTNPDGQSATSLNAFTYDPAPVVSGVAPATGPTAGGTQVIISGSGFRSGATVYFGDGQSPSVSVSSATLIQAVTPPGPKGAADVKVVDPDGQTFVLSGAYTYVAPPSVSGLLPATGPSSGGTVFVINGSDFQPGVGVTIGGAAASVDAASPGQLIVTAPAHAVGSAAVVVTNPDGQQATASTAFAYVSPGSLGPAPTLVSINPGQGPATGGTRVALYGSNFKAASVLIVGGHALTGTRWVDPNTATGLTGPGAINDQVRAVVTNPDGQSAVLANAFTYLDPASLPAAPQLFAVVPSQGSVFGGDPVHGNGQSFTAGSFVMIDGVPQPTTGVTPTRIDFTTQAGPAVGTYAVSVTTFEGQTVTLDNAYTYVVPAPQPQSVAPATGTSLGGDTLTVTGRNFDQGATVKVGNNPATNVTIISPTQLTLKAPPGNDGPAAITVTNPDGQSGTLAGGPGGFTYVAPPQVASVSPTSGPVAGGTSLNITGNFFRSGATVKIGGNPATSVTVVSANVITATTPAGAAGPAAVVVTNADGQSGTLAGGFTYLTPVPPPTVNSVSPNFGPTTGGTLVSVVGNGFQAGAQVFFGGAAATQVNVISATSLTCASPGGQPGSVTVTVKNPDNQAFSLLNGFSYVADSAQPPLLVLAISPNTGSVNGGTSVTITGRGILNGAAVTIGGAAATNVVWLGPTGLQATTPPHAGGLADVTITNPGGANSTLAGGFRYNAGGQYVAQPMKLPMESSGNKVGAILFDFDKDGDSDLLIFRTAGNPNSFPLLYRNDNGVFTDISASAMNVTNLPNDNWNDAVVGDFNGDGWTDVWLVGNSNRSLLQNNFGVFAYVNTFNQGFGCTGRAGATGDVNNDGKLDVVFGCYGQNEQVLLNGVWPDGGAAFPDAGYYFLSKVFGPNPGNDNTTAVVLGDVDKDGDLDVFTAQDTNQAKQLYLNDGKGNFVQTSPGVNFPISPGNSLTAAMRDVNGDGCLDVVVGNNGQQDRLFLNDCQGKFVDFTATKMPADTDSTTQLQLIDVDHDGDYDLVALRTNGNRLRVYLNNGTGTFSDVSVSNTPPSLGEFTVALAKVVPPNPNLTSVGVETTQYDLTNDGYPDLLEINQVAQNRFLQNVGGGSAGVFQYKTVAALPEENDRSYTAVAADINGDGNLDLVKAVLFNPVSGCPTQYDGKIKVLINDGAGNLIDDTANRMPNIDIAAGAMAFIDIDNDGAKDLVVVQAYAKSPNLNNVYLFRNDGAGHFTDVSQQRLPSTNRRIDGAVAVTAFDYNRDGNMDLVIGQGSNLRLWENIGPGFFLDVTLGSSLDTLQSGNCGCNASSGVLGITAGDLDGDNYPDLFVSRSGICSGVNNLVLYNQAGNGSFLDLTASRMPSPSSGRQAVFFDADGNGTLDIYVANGTDDRLYFNLGGSLSDVTLSKLPGRTNNTCSVGVVDVDRDGAWDIILGKNSSCVADSFGGGKSGQQNQLSLNVGTGNYQDFSPSKMPVSNDPTSNVVVGDFNGDGKNDLYFNNEGQSRLYYWQP